MSRGVRDTFYNTPKWRRTKAAYEKTVPHVCVVCGKQDLVGMDLTVDHILPRHDYPDLQYDLNNLQIMCRSCNSSKQNRINVRRDYFNPKWISVKFRSELKAS